MTILVTGASGLLGTSCIRLLSEDGQRVVALDLAPPRSLPENVLFEPGNVTEFRDISAACIKHSVTQVLHLAALVHHRVHQTPLTALQVNVTGFGNILEAARIFGLQRVVYASSVVLYGASTNYSRPVKETDTYRPGNLYGATKAMNEATAAHYESVYGVPVTGLRPHVAFGPGRYDGAAGHFNALIRDCARGRQSTWNRVFRRGTVLAPIHADDMAGAFVHALSGPKLPSPVYNVGGLSQLTEDAMVEVVGRLTNNPDLREQSAGAEYNIDIAEVDCELFMAESGYKYRYDFESAVSACIAFYRQATS